MYTEQHIKDIISHLEHRAEKAHDNAQKWNRTDTTYGDTHHLAADVEFGRAEAFEESVSSLYSLISRVNNARLADEQAKGDSHSCSANAEWTDNGPQGAGSYCLECGALVL